MADIIKGRILVGHAVHNDLKVRNGQMSSCLSKGYVSDGVHSSGIAFVTPT